MPYNLSRILHRDGSNKTHSPSNKNSYMLLNVFYGCIVFNRDGSKNTQKIRKNNIGSLGDGLFGC